MTTVIKGLYRVHAGKTIKKVDTASVSQKIGRKSKADRKEEGYKNNRKAKQK